MTGAASPRRAQADPPTLTDYPAHRRITTRWMDEDAYGHVNNVVYYSFFDTAVNGYLMEATDTDIRTIAAVGLVAETSCSFHRELRFPEDVVAGLRVERLGERSVVYQIGLFQGDSESPAATGRFVHVYVTRTDRAVTPVPDLIRSAVQNLL